MVVVMVTATETAVVAAAVGAVGAGSLFAPAMTSLVRNLIELGVSGKRDDRGLWGQFTCMQSRCTAGENVGTHYYERTILACSRRIVNTPCS